MQLPFTGTYPVTRKFGIYDPVAYFNYPGFLHPGTDFGLGANVPLLAAISGPVLAYDRDPNIHAGRGKEVVITNGGTQVKTCHMNRIDVKNGQFVEKGQQIGLSGFTGYVLDSQGNIGTPGGAHLHFETLVNGQYVDPEIKLKEKVMNPTATEVVYTLRKAFGENYQVRQDELDTYTTRPWPVLVHAAFDSNAFNARLNSDPDGESFRQLKKLLGL